MIVNTKRLELVPLTAHELRLLIFDIKELEKELNCTYKAEPLEGVFLDILKGQLDKTNSDSKNYMWHSFWLMIRKEDRIVVGSFDFKDVPNRKREVEIGYGLGKEFEHNGYMTETVEVMCNWALHKDEVASIIAETEVDNYASQNILKRCGFILTSKAETCWWKRELGVHPLFPSYAPEIDANIHGYDS